MPKPIARSLDFTHTHPQRNFKLLELPPELVELVTAKRDGDGDGGQRVRLSLKSSPAPPSPSASTSTSPPQSAYVNLCTPTQTYLIRNVHSSNSIYLIAPSRRTTSSAEDTDAAQAGIGVLDRNDCVTAIARCGATLELVRVDGGAGGGGNVVGCLRGLGRVFGGARMEGEAVDVDVRMGGGDWDGVTEKERGRVVRRIFADVPFSARECEVGWVEVCGFVYPEGNGEGRLVGWWPSAVVRLEVWRRMVEGAVLQGIELGRQFLVRDLWRAVGDDVEGNVPFPRELVEAVVRRVMADSGSVFEELKWASIDKQVAVSWIGETYLEATAPDPTLAISRDQFLDSWKDLLPEAWRDEATWDNLKVCELLYVACHMVLMAVDTVNVDWLLPIPPTDHRLLQTTDRKQKHPPSDQKEDVRGSTKENVTHVSYTGQQKGKYDNVRQPAASNSSNMPPPIGLYG
ncbi:hypothetical protein FQN50_000996 [Emmonsiellopsis sp. PD_5]|nr:hypothetical protein FQN50_000996 [Emmonsiellopsis sp. PD_5]